MSIFSEVPKKEKKKNPWNFDKKEREMNSFPINFYFKDVSY